MAGLLATGAVQIWVRFVTDDQPQFLGHGERAPDIDFFPSYRNHYTDAGGSDVPTDRVLTGLRARVSVDLARFSMRVLDCVRARARNLRFPAVDTGLADAGQYGVPVVASGCAPRLYLRFPYANKSAFQDPVDGALHDGYRFFAAVLEPEGLRPGGTTSNYKTHLVWDCLRVRAYRKSEFGRGTFRLYDHDLSEIKYLNPD